METTSTPPELNSSATVIVHMQRPHTVVNYACEKEPPAEHETNYTSRVSTRLKFPASIPAMPNSITHLAWSSPTVPGGAG